MNLFFLSADPRRSARDYSNQHVNKILLEVLQMLYSVHHARSKPSLLADAPDGGYRATHKNHPMVRWVGEARANYRLAVVYALALYCESARRFGVRTKTGSKRKGPRHIVWLAENVPPFGPCEQEQTLIPLCMPERFWPQGQRHVTLQEAVEAYRAYYREEKQVFASGRTATWPEGGRPVWLD